MNSDSINEDGEDDLYLEDVEDELYLEDDWFGDVSREYTFEESSNLLKNIPLKHVEKYLRDIKLKNINDVQDR